MAHRNGGAKSHRNFTKQNWSLNQLLRIKVLIIQSSENLAKKAYHFPTYYHVDTSLLISFLFRSFYGHKARCSTQRAKMAPSTA